MMQLKVSGRTILNNSGEVVGKIAGHRPYVNDLQKGAKCDFAIIWKQDNKREYLPYYAYFKDVVKYIKSL